MDKEKLKLNKDVTTFLDDLNHPFRNEIELLRLTILGAADTLTENIKWNGPNYSIGEGDRITMRIQPPKQIQLIFHRGAKVKEQPLSRLIKDDTGLLVWKENDRAVATFKNKEEINNRHSALVEIVKNWVLASS